MPRPRSWSDDSLREAVSISQSLREICRMLGIGSGSKNRRTVRQRILDLGLEFFDIHESAAAAGTGAGSEGNGQ